MPRAKRRSAAPASAPDPRLLREVLAGLGRRPRSLPSRLFYDERGSRLFQWITNLPGHYLTRCEREILERHGDEVARRLGGRPCVAVDLGAGDGHKARLILERLRARCPAVTYVPLDLSPAALGEAEARVRAELPGVAVRPLRAEYADGLRRLEAEPGARLVLFLGSSIGNLEHRQAAAFLRELRLSLRSGDHALVGFDLVKPVAVLRAAYDDPQGVTGAFNLNLLVRLNRELGADFDPAAFRHVATFDRSRPAMESWLESARRQTAHVAGRAFALEAGERIHTEISCKYTRRQVAAFARGAGFAEVARFEDRRRWFLAALWSVA
ncbi:MAG TPA: L-histidine N(alpha)-methyltransferase [Anaeromyxobacteraceae bacterium]|jgi:dimethylhistidine N-methyltransferase